MKNDVIYWGYERGCHTVKKAAITTLCLLLSRPPNYRGGCEGVHINRRYNHTWADD